MAKKITEDIEKEYSVQIKQFLETPAWRDYAFPMIYSALQKTLPSTTDERWQEKYIYAFALSSAFTMVINSLSNLSTRKDFLDKQKKFIDEANGKVDHTKPVDES